MRGTRPLTVTIVVTAMAVVAAAGTAVAQPGALWHQSVPVRICAGTVSQ